LDFDRITRSPNTVKAHGQIVHAQHRGLDIRPLVEALFAAYFTHGEDVSNDDVLLRLATAHGLSADAVRDQLARGMYDIEVHQSQREASRLGVQGVPFLVLDGRYGVSGAQPVEVFVEAPQRNVVVARAAAWSGSPRLRLPTFRVRFHRWPTPLTSATTRNGSLSSRPPGQAGPTLPTRSTFARPLSRA
jgi:hypothetical protein